MTASQQSIETGVTVAAKTAPPVSVSLASVAGYQVNEILLWATLIYTVLMIGHKLFTIVVDVMERRRLSEWRRQNGDRRVGQPDERENRVERRATQL